MSGSEDFRNADQVIVTAVETKPPSNALGEVLDFCSQSVQHPDARARQTVVALNGLVIGGIKDIPNEIVHHPLETTGKVVLSAGAGIGVTALLGLGSPYIAGGTLLAGGAFLGAAAANTWNKACRDQKLSQAMTSTWKSGDVSTLQNSMKIAEERLGREGFDYGVGFAAGGAGIKFAPAVLSRFAPKTIWNFSSNPQWVQQSDGTQVATEQFAGRINTMTKYKDGTIKETTYGNTTTFHPEGGMTQEYANGVKVEYLTNGNTKTSYPNGKTVTVYHGGARETKLGNGTEVHQTSCGGLYITKPDGTKIGKQVDGYKWTTAPNGDTLTVHQNGKRDFWCNSEKTYYDVKPNGEKVLSEISKKYGKKPEQK